MSDRPPPSTALSVAELEYILEATTLISTMSSRLPYPLLRRRPPECRFSFRHSLFPTPGNLIPFTCREYRYTAGNERVDAFRPREHRLGPVFLRYFIFRREAARKNLQTAFSFFPRQQSTRARQRDSYSAQARRVFRLSRNSNVPSRWPSPTLGYKSRISG